MIAQIANFIKEKLAPVLPFINKFGGLISMLVIKEEDAGGNTIEKRFPVSYDTNINDCIAAGVERELVPDGKNYSGVGYIEGQNISVTGSSATNTRFTASLRLVIWYNRDKITGVTYDDALQTKLIKIIYNALTDRIFNAAPLNRIRVRITNVLRDPSIFNAFTYDESVTQYLRPPFDYFAVDMNVDFSVHTSCLADITLNPVATC